MGGFMGWFLVFIFVLAIFNAEKLPALRQMLEAKMKDSVAAAKKGAKKANTKLQQVKTDIENKKNAPAAEKDDEENTPEEIAESLQFMGNYIKDGKDEPAETAEASEKTEDKVEEEPEPEKPAEDAPIDLEHRD
ncbi:MAG: hypothetical protein J6Y91_04240 [Alphaproteobacteria bacterium]|nr:hypothetical protein [Alphaproteobacteria bacterium]